MSCGKKKRSFLVVHTYTHFTVNTSGTAVCGGETPHQPDESEPPLLSFPLDYNRARPVPSGQPGVLRLAQHCRLGGSREHQHQRSSRSKGRGGESNQQEPAGVLKPKSLLVFVWASREGGRREKTSHFHALTCTAAHTPTRNTRHTQLVHTAARTHAHTCARRGHTRTAPGWVALLWSPLCPESRHVPERSRRALERPPRPHPLPHQYPHAPTEGLSRRQRGDHLPCHRLTHPPLPGDDEALP